METSSQLASRLTTLSREQFWNVYEEFDWPEAIDPSLYQMKPELISLYGTEMWDALSEEERKKLSLYEIGNFFSLTLQGERPLVAGLADRLYSKRLSKEGTEYIHHFIDEENKHMVMFGMFVERYLGRVYPEKKLALKQELSKGEEEVAFFCKVLVVEELGDYYNVKMMLDETIEPIVKQLNWVHHRDESRHLGFGRRHLIELTEHWLPKWSDETRQGFRAWLGSYVKSSWADFYNPTAYRDAGLEEPHQVRRDALAHPATAAHRTKASKKLVNIFLRSGLLEEAPTF